MYQTYSYLEIYDTIERYLQHTLGAPYTLKNICIDSEYSSVLALWTWSIQTLYFDFDKKETNCFFYMFKFRLFFLICLMFQFLRPEKDLDLSGNWVKYRIIALLRDTFIFSQIKIMLLSILCFTPKKSIIFSSGFAIHIVHVNNSSVHRSVIFHLNQSLASTRRE